MKYEFKPEMAMRDIEHGVRRFFSENGYLDYTVLLPITTDPTTYVAAYILNEIVPEHCEFIYYNEERFHNEAMDHVVKDMGDKFGDRFDMVYDYDDCRDCAFFIDVLDVSDPMLRLKVRMDIIYAYLISGYTKTPILFDGHESIHLSCGVGNPGYAVNLFANLHYEEIFSIGKTVLGMDAQLIEDAYKCSLEVQTFNDYFSDDIRKLTNDKFTDIEKSLRYSKLAIKYPFKNAMMTFTEYGYFPKTDIFVSRGAFFDKYTDK